MSKEGWSEFFSGGRGEDQVSKMKRSDLIRRNEWKQHQAHRQVSHAEDTSLSAAHLAPVSTPAWLKEGERMQETSL